jgi:hypothetical protein
MSGMSTANDPSRWHIITPINLVYSAAIVVIGFALTHYMCGAKFAGFEQVIPLGFSALHY